MQCSWECGSAGPRSRANFNRATFQGDASFGATFQGDALLRLTGPVRLGLALLALRARVKR
jgi:hypothetical protein